MQIIAPSPTLDSTPLPVYLMTEKVSATSPLSGGERQLVSKKTIQTILIADDSQTERTNLARILKEAGYEVIAASSGNEARTLAEQHEPDVIFLDIIMEDGDGYQACRHIRRNPALADTPIIMVSSKANPVDIKWAEKLGATNYVVKPYTPQAILDQLLAL